MIILIGILISICKGDKTYCEVPKFEFKPVEGYTPLLLQMVFRHGDRSPWVHYKGDKASEELKEAENAINILSGELSSVKTFSLPGTDISRTLISIKKTRPTPDKYPRKAGLPNKKPIK